MDWISICVLTARQEIFARAIIISSVIICAFYVMCDGRIKAIRFMYGLGNWITRFLGMDRLFIIIIIAAIAAILGDIFAYELARKFSIAIESKIQKYKFFRNNEIKAKKFLSNYEFFALFITRFFLTGLCAVISYISGFTRLNRKKYIAAVILGEILYAVIFTTLGYVFRLAWNDLVNILDNFIIITILSAVTIVLIIIFRRRIKRKKSVQVYEM